MPACCSARAKKSFEKYEAGQITPSKPTQLLLRLAMEQPNLFTKDVTRQPKSVDRHLIESTIREAHLDRIYAPLFRDPGPGATARRPDR